MARRHGGNEERRRKMAELRQQGLTLDEIGRRFGVTRERVRQVLKDSYQRRRFRVRCRACGGDINPAGALPRDDRAALCLACLAKTPGATFGEHLYAHRLAAGLKVAELAGRVGVSPSLINFYEHGRGSHPKWELLVRIFAVFGIAPFGPPPNGTQHKR